MSRVRSCWTSALVPLPRATVVKGAGRRPDLTITVSTGGDEMIAPVGSTRDFLQDDGTVHLDCTVSGNIAAFTSKVT